MMVRLPAECFEVFADANVAVKAATMTVAAKTR
jgi:hypothetical protein